RGARARPARTRVRRPRDAGDGRPEQGLVGAARARGFGVAAPRRRRDGARGARGRRRARGVRALPPAPGVRAIRVGGPHRSDRGLAVSPQATAEIWRFLFDVDWMSRIEAHLLPVDHPLFFLLAEPRLM